MARKRIKGRGRIVTKESQLILKLNKVNKKLQRLDDSNVYGSYASKKLLQSTVNQKGISYKRDSNTKLRVNLRQLSVSDIRYYSKVFDKFLNHKTSSKIGIEEVRNKSRESLKSTLSQISDKDIDDNDIDNFYTIVSDEDFRYLADKIGDSDVYILVNEAKDKNMSYDSFISMLENYMTVNSEEVRDITENIYNKYVR